MVAEDPLPLIRKLLDAGANRTHSSTTRGAPGCAPAPRASSSRRALMRAAFAGDLELVKLLLAHGADPKVISSDGETMVAAAAGLGFIQGYSKGKSPAERLEVVKLFVELGATSTRPTTTASRR